MADRVLCCQTKARVAVQWRPRAPHPAAEPVFGPAARIYWLRRPLQRRRASCLWLDDAFDHPCQPSPTVITSVWSNRRGHRRTCRCCRTRRNGPGQHGLDAPTPCNWTPMVNKRFGRNSYDDKDHRPGRSSPILAEDPTRKAEGEHVGSERCCGMASTTTTSFPHRWQKVNKEARQARRGRGGGGARTRHEQRTHTHTHNRT